MWVMQYEAFRRKARMKTGLLFLCGTAFIFHAQKTLSCTTCEPENLALPTNSLSNIPSDQVNSKKLDDQRKRKKSGRKRKKRTGKELKLKSVGREFVLMNRPNSGGSIHEGN